MDITAALTAELPDVEITRCRLGRFIRDIPADTPGLDDLIAALENSELYTAPTMSKVLFRLGCNASATLVRAHRRGDCACNGRS